MAHHIYHTRGIILGSAPRGESNRYYKIFTEELGLIGATAQAVREGKSKLRYVLQDFSFVHVDLVRGKEMWRITSASELATQDIAGGTDQKKIFMRTCSLLARLLQGEGREQKLFKDFFGIADFLKEVHVPNELCQSTEALVALRALATLGYIDAKGYEAFLDHGTYSLPLISQFESVRPSALRLISTSLTASHL